jgi:hypothetical protein
MTLDTLDIIVADPDSDLFDNPPPDTIVVVADYTPEPSTPANN